MLPNLIREFLQKPKTLQAISFLKVHQTILVVIFLSCSIVFTGSLFLFSQSGVRVLGTKIVKPTHSAPFDNAQGKSSGQAATPKPTLTSTQSPTLRPTNTPLPTVTPTPTNTPSSGSTSTGGKPSSVLDLSNWKLTIPTGNSESPTEILQPALKDYVHDVWFSVNGGGVRFRAPVNAVTTSGSNYPRSELREMTNGGKDKASWSSTNGTHTMMVDQAITSLPQKKQHVVAGQIHDSDDDVIVIRLEGKHLFVDVGGDTAHTLDTNYNLGTRFTVKFEVSGGQTHIHYNGTKVYTLSKDYSGAYFKAGAYTQSNCSKEDNCSENNYAEVIIYSLSISHS